MLNPSPSSPPSVVRRHFRWSNYSLENLGLFNCSVTFNRLLHCQNLQNFTENFVGVDVNKKNTITIICSKLGVLYDSTLPSNHFNLSTEGSDTALDLHNMYYFYIKLIKNIYISSFLLTSIFIDTWYWLKSENQNSLV